MFYKINRFFNKIIRVLKWSKIIWKSETFDYSYSIQIFKESLIELRNTLLKNNRFISTQCLVDRLNTVIKLIDICYYSDYYSDKYNEVLYNTYGKELFDINFQKIDGSDYYTLKLKYELLDDKELIEIIRNDYHKTMELIRFNEDKAKRLLWKMIDNYIEKFWD